MISSLNTSSDPDDSFLSDARPNAQPGGSGLQYATNPLQPPLPNLGTLNPQDIGGPALPPQQVMITLDALQFLSIPGAQALGINMGSNPRPQGDSSQPNAVESEVPQIQTRPPGGANNPSAPSSRASFESLSPPGQVQPHPSKNSYAKLDKKSRRLMPHLEKFQRIPVDPESSVSQIDYFEQQIELRIEGLQDDFRELRDLARSKIRVEKEYLKIHQALTDQRECVRQYRNECADIHRTADQKLKAFMAPFHQKIDCAKSLIALRDTELAQSQALCKSLSAELEQARKRISELESLNLSLKNPAIVQKEPASSTSRSPVFLMPSRAAAKRARFEVPPIPRGPSIKAIATPVREAEFEEEFDD